MKPIYFFIFVSFLLVSIGYAEEWTRGDAFCKLTGCQVTGNITSKNVFIPQYAFSHTDETIPVIAAMNWTNITFGQEVTDILQGIAHTHSGLDNDTFTFSMDGIYDIDYDIDAEDTSPSASDIDVAVRLVYVNETEVVGSVFETDITKQGTEIELSHNFLMMARAGEQVKLQFIATDADVEISTHGTFGEHPESATIIIMKIANLP